MKFNSHLSVSIVLFLTLIIGAKVYSQSPLYHFNKATQFYYSGNITEAAYHLDSSFRQGDFTHLFLQVIIDQALKSDANAIAFLEEFENLDLQNSQFVKPVNQLIKLYTKIELGKKIDPDKFLDNALVKDNISPFSSQVLYQAYKLLEEDYIEDPYRKILWLVLIEHINDEEDYEKGSFLSSFQSYIHLCMDYEYAKMGCLKDMKPKNLLISASDKSNFKQITLFNPPYSSASIDTMLWTILNCITDEDKFRSNALDLLRTSPSLINQTIFASSFESQTMFEEFWRKESRTNWASITDIPKLLEFIELERSSDQWVIIDVWGTWCSPCVKELPFLDSLYHAMRKIEGQPFSFLSLSYNSTNLQQFMKEHNYHFPVMEIGREMVQQLNVKSFPTKILIAPDNRFILVPQDVDLLEFIEIYSLQKGTAMVPK